MGSICEIVGLLGVSVKLLGVAVRQDFECDTSSGMVRVDTEWKMFSEQAKIALRSTKRLLFNESEMRRYRGPLPTLLTCKGQTEGI